jgi:hypothetical protein
MNELMRKHLELDLDYADEQTADASILRELDLCASLIPDHARDRISVSPHCHMRYVLVPEEDDKKTQKAPAAYLVQCRSQPYTATQSHDTDNDTLVDILQAYWSGFRSVPSSVGASEESLCRWRGCFSACDSSSFGATQLCDYHFKLKAHLEASGQNVANYLSSKKLFGKALSSGDVEEEGMLSRFSPFINDFRSGVIRKALKSFLRKQCEDLKHSSVLSTVMDIQSRPLPEWSAWKNPKEFEE